MSKWYSTITVSADIDNRIMEQIPTKDLEEELKERKELKETDIEKYKRKERQRCCSINIEIDPDDYGLIDQNDISLSNFRISEITDYLKHNGYAVFAKHGILIGNADAMRRFLDELPKFKYKEVMCDILGLPQMSTVDNIIEKLKEKI